MSQVSQWRWIDYNEGGRRGRRTDENDTQLRGWDRSSETDSEDGDAEDEQVAEKGLDEQRIVGRMTRGKKWRLRKLADLCKSTWMTKTYETDGQPGLNRDSQVITPVLLINGALSLKDELLTSSVGSDGRWKRQINQNAGMVNSCSDKMEEEQKREREASWEKEQLLTKASQHLPKWRIDERPHQRVESFDFSAGGPVERGGTL
jgi:hypothetical protein